MGPPQKILRKSTKHRRPRNMDVLSTHILHNIRTIPDSMGSTPTTRPGTRNNVRIPILHSKHTIRSINHTNNKKRHTQQPTRRNKLQQSIHNEHTPIHHRSNNSNTRIPNNNDDNMPTHSSNMEPSNILPRNIQHR